MTGSQVTPLDQLGEPANPYGSLTLDELAMCFKEAEARATKLLAEENEARFLMAQFIREMPFHPLAETFPLMEGQQLKDLVADIKAHGLREPIVTYQDKILDGRNRFLACMAAGIDECASVSYTGNDPLGYIVSLNLKRRHLDESQRAMIAARLATMAQGARTDLSPIGEKSQAQAAELLNVGKRSVERAKKVREHGTPELQAAVERGEVSVSAAAEIATETPEQQREAVARAKQRQAVVARTIRPATTKPAQPKRVTHRDLLELWMRLAVEERRHFFDGIGLRTILESIPETWIGALERWLDDRRQQSKPTPNPNPVIH
jgi:ParB-like chromosome segregation protein Spo0J